MAKQKKIVGVVSATYALAQSGLQDLLQRRGDNFDHYDFQQAAHIKKAIKALDTSESENRELKKVIQIVKRKTSMLWDEDDLTVEERKLMDKYFG